MLFLLNNLTNIIKITNNIGMKKFKFFNLTLLLLVCITFFAGCSETKYFSISTKSSNSEIGTGNGSINKTWAEGSELNLIATSKNEDKFPFICWVKDGTKVYSTQSNTRLKVSADTEGVYTAVFSEGEDNINGMMYAALTNITYPASDFTNIYYTVRYAPEKNAGMEILHCEGESQETSMNTFSDNVFCLLEDTQLKGYIFSLTITTVKSNGDEEITTFKNIKLSNNLFNGSEYKYQDEFNRFSLTFSKLSKQLLAQ